MIQYTATARMHIGLEVSDLERSVAFYRTLLGRGPVKERPGYAKFELEQPSLNLSLNQGTASRAAHPGGSGHFGIQVDSTEEVQRILTELGKSPLPTTVEEDVECCYARQDKVWAVDPDGNPWEVFAVLGEAGPRTTGCCTPASAPARQSTPAGTEDPCCGG